MNNLDFERLYKKMGFASQRRYPNEVLIRFLAAHYFSIPRQKRKNIRILELGCGSGANLWMIAKEGFDTYGMDIAVSAIPLCKQMLKSYGTKAQVSVGNIKKLDFKDSFFDAIVDVMTTEHVDLRGHEETYQEIFRALKPGGRFFSWHLGSESASFKKSSGKKIDALTLKNIPEKMLPYNNAGLTCFITPTVATRLLKKAGFIDIKMEEVVRTHANRAQRTQFLAIEAKRPE